MTMDRDNSALNAEIEKQMAMWEGTIHGYQIKSAWDNGCDYETLCELCGLDYADYEDD